MPCQTDLISSRENPMNYTEQNPGVSYGDTSSEPLSLSHLTRAIGRYRNVIFISMLAVAFAYAILAVFLYVTAPSRKITSQPFRLDFEGASEGHFATAVKFNVADLINGPILQQVYRDNQLSDLISYQDFAQSIFVLESNRAADLLASEYAARIADPKLSPIDRERIQNEYELKLKSIAKNEYSINFVRSPGLRVIPEPIARKVLLSILNRWADFAVNQQHVLAYQIAVLSPDILKPTAGEQNDSLAATQILRRRALRVISNIKDIQMLPGGKVVRTPADRVSLEEVRLRLEEIIRFRLEPLAAEMARDGLLPNRAASINFLESQLAFDRRQLQTAEAEAENIRRSAAMYEGASAQPATTTAERSPAPANSGTAPGVSETVMPQISDTFLDRLLSLTGRSAELSYRQKLVDDYRKSLEATVPAQQAVTYDEEILKALRNPSGPKTNIPASAVRSQIDEARTDIGHLIEKTNELYQLINRNMTASTQLFTLTSAPTARTVRATSIGWLALYGVLVLLFALPLTVVFCLLHNRIREEEASENTIPYAERSPVP